MPFGYHGAYLRVDVSTGSVERVPLADEVLRRCLGGSGLGAWILLQENAARLDPFDVGAAIVFAFSPLVGSPLTTSAKFAVVSKGPLTGRLNDALASSGFAISGKACGCDALVIVGRAPQWSTLVIDDPPHAKSSRSPSAGVRLESADDLVGLTCVETETALKARLGGGFRIASIGPAGERLVRYATISHDGRHAGRGGSGAILGAKRLKAIAVRGHQRVEWARPDALTALSRDLSTRSFGPATAKYRELGTASNLLTFNRLNALPTRNFQQGSFEEAERLSPEQLTLTRAKARASCVACTIGCEHIYAVRSDDREDGVRVEYESLSSLGSLCGVSDADAVLRGVQRCNELGMDTISTGATIAFAMDCVDRGWLDASWLRFGSGDALLRAIDLIGSRHEIGDVLAEGSRRAAAVIGHDSLAIAPQVKGLEIPGYEPRALQTMALGFAVGTRGADHNRSGAYEVDFSDRVDRRHVTVESVRYAIETEDKAALMDSLILCKFLRGVFPDFYAEAATILESVTGWEVTASELRATARGIVALKLEFNRRAGWTMAEDTLPARFFDAPLADDPTASLSRTRLEALVGEYHRQRG